MDCRCGYGVSAVTALEPAVPELSNVHTEKVFEDELCAHLAAHGWSVRTHLKDAKTYSRELALFPDDLLAFVQATQPLAVRPNNATAAMLSEANT